MRVRRVIAGLAAALLASGCAGRYFEAAGAPPEPAPQYRLAQWPYSEYWTGIVFNGARIGFTHLRLTPAADAPGQYDIHQQAVFVLRFLGLSQRFEFTGVDRVREDLTLVSFDYDYDLDGRALRVSGRVDAGQLRARIGARDNVTEQQLPVAGPLYPTAVLPLYPAYAGLVPGRRYAYMVYDGQTQQIGAVRQEITGYERSSLFQGPAYKVVTGLHGHSTTTWLAADARPVFELALNGVLISALETEAEAKRYLVQASLNKQDAMLNFSLVPVTARLPDARATRLLDLELTGLTPQQLPAPDARQQCAPQGKALRCRVIRIAPPAGVPLSAGDMAATETYRRSSLTVPAGHPRIQAQARDIAGGEREPLAVIARLLDWLRANIRQEPVDNFSALDVLSGGRAECQGHSYLYTAFARALGIPTRVVNGMVYSPQHGGFLYHTWTESAVNGQWIAVDPTFGQIGVDATHIKLVEGESAGDLLPLVEIVGRVQARVLAVE